MSKVGKIAFQGEPGAYAHIACCEAYPTHDAVPCATFENAFAAVEAGKADLAMLPIENSLAGRVPDVHHLMRTSRLRIMSEWFLPVRHQLMAARGANLDMIRFVQSHAMALAQCRNVIRRLDLRPQAVANTASAARDIAASGDPTRAAIASRLAANIYGLDIVAENVEDESHHMTRFITLAREATWPSLDTTSYVTTLVFRTRNLPAALYKALGGFATNGVNIAKLESYLVGGTFSPTEFYADIEGHPEHCNVNLALEELTFYSDELRILGVYPAYHGLGRGAHARTPYLAQFREPSRDVGSLGEMPSIAITVPKSQQMTVSVGGGPA